ncbi:MAG: MlaE family ABC transporter permease, partial [Verrucomicrobiota bacterium]
LVGIAASYLIGVNLLGIDGAYYLANIHRYTEPYDVFTGLLKALVFGGIISLVSCYKGLNSGGGAEGVGRATTEAVVASSISILITNFFLTLFLTRLFKAVN